MHSKFPRSAVVGILIVGAVALSVGVAVQAMRTSADVLNDAYAMQASSKLFVRFLEHNPNVWPAGWGDLEPEYENAKRDGGYELSLTDLMTRVQIDFAMTEERFRNDAAERILTLPTGRYAHLAGEDPNEFIRDWCEQHRWRTEEPDMQ